MERTILWAVNDHVKETVPKKINKTKKMVDEDIEILQEWMKTQKHLPEFLEGEIIRNVLNFNKGSIERSKKSIDCYYTMRSTFPEFTQNVHPKYPHMKRVLDIVYFISLPKLTGDMCRITVFKIRDESLIDEIDFQHLYANIINSSEIRLREDYYSSNIVIVDFLGVTLDCLKRQPVHLIIKLAMVYKQAFKVPVKAVYFLNAPRFINVFMALIKMAFPEKIIQRIHFLQNYDDLKDFIPEEILPVDLGGHEICLEELNEMLKRKYEECEELFNRLEKLKVDENLRPMELKNDEVLGIHGNFKMLTVD